MVKAVKGQAKEKETVCKRKNVTKKQAARHQRAAAEDGDVPHGPVSTDRKSYLTR